MAFPENHDRFRPHHEHYHHNQELESPEIISVAVPIPVPDEEQGSRRFSAKNALDRISRVFKKVFGIDSSGSLR